MEISLEDKIKELQEMNRLKDLEIDRLKRECERLQGEIVTAQILSGK